MEGSKQITIIGGGLAGLTLGIGLRSRSVPVTIREAGTYPRHRVCGEFITGRGQDALARLGLRDLLLEAGAIMGRTASFFLGKARSPLQPVMPPAWCLSRFIMDELLARRFRDEGGQLLENSRWSEACPPEGFVLATGRRIQRLKMANRWFGLKVHARQVQLEADLEMHGLNDGYVGLCRLPDDKVNVCGLFRRHDNPHPIGSWERLLRGLPGTALRSRLQGAVFEPESFCSIAGLGLTPHRAAEQMDLSIGDALTMIPPVTGNGMSMAFEAAARSLDPLTDYSKGRLSWVEARNKVTRACDMAFARRLAWARWLQWFMFAGVAKTQLGAVALHSRALWRLMFAMTR
jgi:flavin-dependent dehydrogenase